jgi:16S rRNA (guanine527-N7)-methyltransferase
LTEDDARAWLVERLDVSRETLEKLHTYEALVRAGQETQNLISASTLPIFWSRHVVDSAQLALHAIAGSWLDIGSGAGIPGMITAIITGAPTLLVEPRAKRADFLLETAASLGLKNVRVAASSIEKLSPEPVDNITARALAALPALLEIAVPFAHKGTIWLLPKGKSAQSELASLPRAWQGVWEVHASVTDPDSKILIGRDIRVKSKR